MSGNDHAHNHPNYILIYVILLALLVVSIIGPELEIPAVTLLTAFGIAIVKAYMVCAYFMHLKFEKRYISLLLFASVGLLFLFFAALAPDVMKKSGDNWVGTGHHGIEAREHHDDHGHSHKEGEAHDHDHKKGEEKKETDTTAKKDAS